MSYSSLRISKLTRTKTNNFLKRSDKSSAAWKTFPRAATKKGPVCGPHANLNADKAVHGSPVHCEMYDIIINDSKQNGNVSMSIS